MNKRVNTQNIKSTINQLTKQLINQPVGRQKRTYEIFIQQQPKTRVQAQIQRHHQEILIRKFSIQLPYSKFIYSTSSIKLGQQSSDTLVQKMQQSYDIQSLVDSDYVTKNLGFEIFSQELHVYQEHFDCLLAQLPLKLLTFGKRLAIIHTLAKGLKFLKDNLICHRYLNLHTICIRKTPQNNFIAKINTFDFAIKLQNHKSKFNVMSENKGFCNNFSAPEIKKNQPSGFSSDVWSLGLIINYILYSTTSNIWEQDGQIKVQVPKGTPNWLYQLLHSMLYENPYKRYTIQNVLDVLKVSLKCWETLQKIIPIGSSQNQINFSGVQSGFNYQL